MTTTLAPTPVFRQYDNNGNPLVGGQLFTYQAGTTTPLASYTDSTGSTPNTNPVILNSRGEAQVWLPPNTAYKLVLQDSLGNQIWSVDQIVNAQLLTLYGGVDTGIANAYVLNFAAPYSGYVNGTIIYWVPANTSTGGSSTLNVNGFGPINIVNPNGTNVNAGQIVANQLAEVVILDGQAELVSAGAATGLASFAVSGVTGVSNINCIYSIYDGQVALTIPSFSGVGTGTTFAMFSTNTLIQPPTHQPQWATIHAAQDNGANIYSQTCVVQALIFPSTPGTLVTFNKNGNPSGWVTTGTRGIGDSTSVTGAYGITIYYPA